MLWPVACTLTKNPTERVAVPALATYTSNQGKNTNRGKEIMHKYWQYICTVSNDIRIIYRPHQSNAEIRAR